MKFSCEKALLQNAISVTSRAVAQKSSIPALEGLLLHAGEDGLTVSGYNMQTGIRAKVSAGVEETGEIVLNARLFGDIIRRMPDDTVTFISNEKYRSASSAATRTLISPASPRRITPTFPRWRTSMPFPCNERSSGP